MPLLALVYTVRFICNDVFPIEVVFYFIRKFIYKNLAAEIDQDFKNMLRTYRS